MAELVAGAFVAAFMKEAAGRMVGIPADVVSDAATSAATALIGHVEDVLTGIESYLSVVGTLHNNIYSRIYVAWGTEARDKGSPLLKYNAAFIAFVITDSLSFVLSTSAVLLIFFAILGEKFKHDLFKNFSRELVGISIMLTMVAMGLMVIAFGTGLYAVLGVSKGFGVVTLVIVLSFFFIVIMVFRTVIRKESERKKESEGKIPSEGKMESEGEL